MSLIALGLLASLFEGIGIGLFIPFLERLEASQAVTAHDNVTHQTWLGSNLARLFEGVAPENQLPAIGAAIFGAVLLKGALSYATALLSSSLSARTGHELRTRVYEEVLTVDFHVIHKLGTGRLLNVLSNESWRTADAVINLLHAVISLGTFFVYMALLLTISWKLTLIVTAILLLMSVIVRSLTRKVGFLGAKMTRANADVASRMVDGVDGIEVIRGYGQESHARRSFESVSERLSKLTMRTGILSGAVHPVYEILAAAVLVTVLLMSVQAGASLAPLLVFIFLLYRLAPLVRHLEAERVDLISSQAAVKETLAIIQSQEKQYIQSGDEEFDGLEEEIVLDKVSYRYEPDADLALEGIEATLPAKGLTAIVGRSGSGKSTLVKLLLRFFDPTEGRILVEGRPLPALKLNAWRSRIAVVPQRAYLFNATVRDNIAFGELQADDEEVEAAAKAAGADTFIPGLPNSYNTRLGEDGIELSGGEAQRICLARALIREPDLLLLDEATNALDSISEDLIHVAVDRIRLKCAVVVVAHRLATIESADQILVLDNGRLVEQGGLQELIAKGGLFADLYQRQRFV
jgi:subfamily B ATP-binding cassette protein MsbA